MQRRTRLAAWSLILTLLCAAGCLRFCHPIEPLPPEDLHAIGDVAQCQRNKVHVFFVHGLDPLDLANYVGLHDYVRSLDYIKTYFGRSYHAFHFEKELRELHHKDPDVRIVLVGFCYGAGMVRDIACSVRAAGVPIDLVVYLDAVKFQEQPLHRPANVARVVNILGCSRGDEHLVKEAENHRLDDVGHFGTATHPQTLRLLACELAEVARRVPIVQYLPPVIVAPGEKMPTLLPPPTEITNGKPDEWGFLRPDAHAQGSRGAKPGATALGSAPATIREVK